jgi:hypothetical protein
MTAPPLNRQRAQRAQRTLVFYSARYDDADGWASATADLLADLMHLHGERFNDCLQVASTHYDAETEEAP